MKAANSSVVPYINSTKRILCQTGFGQSFSGSETDVSTSNENLTAEEKNVLRSGVRQEPQGEETLTDDMDAALSNTLVIRNNSSIDGYTSPFYAKSNWGNNSVSCTAKQNLWIEGSAHFATVNQSETLQTNHQSKENMNRADVSPILKTSENNVPCSPKISSHHIFYPSHVSNTQLPGSPKQLHQFSPGIFQASSSAATTTHTYTYSSPQGGHSCYELPVQDLTEIPKHYLDQSEVLKHLAKEVHYQQVPNDSYNFPPPPHYPKWNMVTMQEINDSDFCKISPIGLLPMRGGAISEKPGARMSISRSHPDLSRLETGSKLEDPGVKIPSVNERPRTRGRVAVEVDSEQFPLQAAQLIDLLSHENDALKSELDMYYKKVSKLQKFELEIQKVHQSHEELVRSSEKREKLERAIRTRLEMEIRRQRENNKEIKEQLEAATSQLAKRPLTELDDSELQKEIGRKDMIVAQLLGQNKELMAEKERQEIELQAQRATLQEQRNHIDILDNALTNAQANVMKLEEECRKKQVYVERAAQLQKALANLQVASDRRLQMEKKVREQLEEQIASLKHKDGKTAPQSNGSNVELEDLKKTATEYEEKIIKLESEVNEWQQRYLEESTMRQIAVDAASLPKDAKIAALERTSQESEKLIALVRTEKLKQMDELYAAHRKTAELEGRIKDLESKLAERDAMIKVLQHHSQEKDEVFQNAVLGRPSCHTRAASTVGLSTNTSHTTTTVGSSLGKVSSSSCILHRRTGSKDELGASSVTKVKSSECLTTSSANSGLPTSSDSADSKKSLDEQMEELDSRLSNKDSIIHALRAEKQRYPSHFWRV